MNGHLRSLFKPAMIFFLIRLSSVLFSSFSAAPLEEQYTGVMARLLTSDAGIPWFELSMGPQEMVGRTSVAWLCAGSFWIFGSNLVALKLPAVLLSTISFVLWHSLLLRLSDRFTMWISAFLWFFPPPLIQGISIIPFGNHWENTINFAIILLCLSIWYDRFSEDRWLVLAGLSAGLSFVFCQNALPLIISMVAVLIVADRKRLTFANLSAASAAFAAPVILFSILMHLRTGSYFSLYNVSSDTVRSVCKMRMITFRLQECFLEHLPLSAANPLIGSEVNGNFVFLRFTASWWLLSASFLGFLVLLRSKRTRWIAIISVGFIIMFCWAWSFSGHSISATRGYLTYRYFSALYPFLFLLIALALHTISLPEKRCISCLSILPIVVPNLLYYFSQIDPASFNRAISANGSSWTTISEWLTYSHNSPIDDRRSSEDRNRLLHSIATITNPLERDQIGWGLGGHAAVLYQNTCTLTESVRSFYDMPDDFSDVPGAMAVGLATALPPAGVMSPDELANALIHEDEDFKSEFYAGLGVSIGLLNERTGRKSFVTWALIPERYRENVALGYGFSLPIAFWGRRSFLAGQSIPEFFDQRARVSFAYGFGTAMAWFYPGSGNYAKWMESSFNDSGLLPVMKTAYYSAIDGTRTMSW